jgi:glutaredoxin 3
MTRVLIYTKDWCGYCQAAKQLLGKIGYTYQEIDVTDDLDLYRVMREKAGGRSTVPQIFFDDINIGGYTDLLALVQENRLPPV